MDIAAMSVALSQNKVMQQASVSVAKKAMDAAEVQMQGVVQMMQGASGQHLDIKV